MRAFRFPTTLALVLPILTVVSGCGTPDEESIASFLEDHLAQVASGGLDEDTRAAMETEVLSVEASQGGELEVAFRVFDPRHPGAGVDSLRGPVQTAWLAREGESYEIRRYGESLARSVAVLIAADRRQRYEDLLEPLVSVRDSARNAMSGWAKPMRTEFFEATEDRREEIRQELDAGVPSDTFRRGILDRWEPPDALQFGVVDQEGRASVVYLRAGDRPDEVCAYRVSLNPPDAVWSWLVGEFINCRGRGGGVYVEEYPPQTIFRELPVHQDPDPSGQS